MRPAHVESCRVYQLADVLEDTDIIEEVLAELDQQEFFLRVHVPFSLYLARDKRGSGNGKQQTQP